MMGEKKLILPPIKLGRHPLWLPPFSPVSLTEHLGAKMETVEKEGLIKVEIATFEVVKPTTAEVLQYGCSA